MYVASKNKRSQLAGAPGAVGGGDTIIAAEVLTLRLEPDELRCGGSVDAELLELEIKRHDIEPNLVLVITNDDDSAYDFTGFTNLIFIMRKVDAEPGDTAKIDGVSGTFAGDPSLGKLVYIWSTGDTDTCGTYRAEFQALNASGRKRSFPGTNKYIKVTIPEDLNES